MISSSSCRVWSWTLLWLQAVGPTTEQHWILFLSYRSRNLTWSSSVSCSYFVLTGLNLLSFYLELRRHLIFLHLYVHDTAVILVSLQPDIFITDILCLTSLTSSDKKEYYSMWRVLKKKIQRLISFWLFLFEI